MLIIYGGFGPDIPESSQGASPNIEVPRLSLVTLCQSPPRDRTPLLKERSQRPR